MIGDSRTPLESPIAETINSRPTSTGQVDRGLGLRKVFNLPVRDEFPIARSGP